MQPRDPDDKRQPNVQIAASIRAAILTGELAPGAQLPTGQELAKFFGVSRMTVTAALRTLREEGFVRSQSGSGVYVRDQANLPAPPGEDHPLAGMAAFLFEMGHLKNVPRAGWLLLGIPSPESIAENLFRVGVVGIVLGTGWQRRHRPHCGTMHPARRPRNEDRRHSVSRSCLRHHGCTRGRDSPPDVSYARPGS